MQIELHPVTVADRPNLAELAQLYLRDVSRHEPLALDDHGSFASDLLGCVDEPGGFGFLIVADGETVGFIIGHGRSRLTHSGTVRAVEALFVRRDLRRAGIGSQAAALLFNAHSGRWELSASGRNIPAQAFYRSVAQRYTHGDYHEIWLTGSWRGAVNTLISPPRHSA